MFDDEDEDINFFPSFEERFQHLILASSCLGALRLLRLRRIKDHPIGSLVSSRPADHSKVQVF
jgi:hypothetical protein